jgi:hypothetical protein
VALPERADDIEIFWALDGTPRAATWSPVPMRLVTRERGTTLARADMPWLGHQVIVLRDAAAEILGHLLAEQGELLPLACPDAVLHVFNVLHVIDAMDAEASRITWLPSGAIMTIDSLVLRPDALDEPLIFKLPQMLRGPLYFTRPIVDEIGKTGLTGLGFSQVATARG